MGSCGRIALRPPMSDASAARPAAAGTGTPHVTREMARAYWLAWERVHTHPTEDDKQHRPEPSEWWWSQCENGLRAALRAAEGETPDYECAEAATDSAETLAHKLMCQPLFSVRYFAAKKLRELAAAGGGTAGGRERAQAFEEAAQAVCLSCAEGLRRVPSSEAGDTINPPILMHVGDYGVVRGRCAAEAIWALAARPVRPEGERWDAGPVMATEEQMARLSPPASGVPAGTGEPRTYGDTTGTYADTSNAFQPVASRPAGEPTDGALEHSYFAAFDEARRRGHPNAHLVGLRAAVRSSGGAPPPEEPSA